MYKSNFDVNVVYLGVTAVRVSSFSTENEYLVGEVRKLKIASVRR